MNSPVGQEALRDVYALISELWCGPLDADVNQEQSVDEPDQVIAKWGDVDRQSATLLTRFLRENTTSEEDYIEMFELDPQCALYLGSHTFDEPKTCASAGVSDRNGYMIELVGIYNHFKRKPNGSELPDYLPLVVDFLSLSTEWMDDPIRTKLINDYVLPYLPAMRSQLENLKTPYLLLFDALSGVIETDVKAQPA